MANDLRRFPNLTPIEARKASISESCPKWIKRYASVARTAMVSLAVVAAIALLTHRAYVREAEQRAAADGYLQSASQIINGSLSRASIDVLHESDLKQAEVIAANSTNLYEELLRRSDVADVRY